MNTSTGQSKSRGMDNKEYQEIQHEKADEQFKFSTNQRLQNLQFAIDRLNKSLDESIANQGSDKKELDIEMTEIMNSCMSSLKEFRQELGDISSQLKKYDSLLEKVFNEVLNCVTVHCFTKNNSDFEEKIDKLRKEKEAIKKDIKDQFNRQYADFSSQLQTMKEEILNIPSEIPALKKLFDQKLEIVELNGQNAVLRSSNNEKQIMLVERKIENIYQLLKKLDLSIQETK